MLDSYRQTLCRLAHTFLRVRPFRLSTLSPQRPPEAREVVAPWRFHLKRRRNRFPVPYSLFPALAGSPEALAVPQLDAEDSVLVSNAEQREVFSECPFKLDDLVL